MAMIMDFEIQTIKRHYIGEGCLMLYNPTAFQQYYTCYEQD